MASLIIENLGFKYCGSHNSVIEGFDLRLEAGAFCLVTGGCGSGKTTLLKCIKRELSLAGTITGSIKLDDFELADKQTAPNISMVLQNPNAQIVCDSVVSELAFSLENNGVESGVIERRIAECCSYFGLSHLLNKKTHELSDGEKQLLCLASACITTPEVLLLDEPTVYLDEKSTRSICAALNSLNKDLGITVIVATHSPEIFEKYATDTVDLKRADCFDDGFASSESPKYYNFECATFRNSRTHEQSEDKNKPAIRFENVSFAYEATQAQSSDACFEELDFELAFGDVMTLLGSNGSGKSTLLKLAAKILRPNKGKIVHAKNYTQAYLPQDVRMLFSKDTVRKELESIASFKGASDADIDDVLRFIHLENYSLCNPYDLSDGQRQLLGLAMIAFSGSDLILLDEPTKFLDKQFRDIAKNLILHMSKDSAAILLCTHDLKLAASVSSKCALTFNKKITLPVSPVKFFEDSAFMKKAIYE